MPVGKITLKLTAAQLPFLLDTIRAHTRVGDCKRRGDTVEFGDYEGAQSFRSDALKLLEGISSVPSSSSRRAYASLNTVLRTLDAAIVEAAEQGAK